MAAVDVELGLPVAVNLTAYRGDYWSQTFRLLRGELPVDLTGADVRAACRAAAGEVYPMVATVTDATDGLLAIGLTADGAVEPGDYGYDLQVDEGGVPQTWVRGRLRVLQDVTV